MDKRTSCFAANFLAFLLPCLGFGSDQVPVIAWSNTNYLLSAPGIDAGHVVTQQSLQQDYLDVIPMDKPHNLFLIVMDKLSIDDITRYSNANSNNPDGGTLTHLKSAMQSSASHLVVPAAEAFDLEGDLRSRVTGQVVELSTSSFKDLNLDSSKSNLIIMRLHSASSATRQAAMSALDQALLQIIGQLPDRFSPYTVVLSAQQPSILPKENANSVNIGRRLMADSNGTSNGTDLDQGYILIDYTENTTLGYCKLYLYTTGISLKVENVTGAGVTEVVVLPLDNDWDISESECIGINNTIKFVMKHSNISYMNTTTNITSSNITSFKLSMLFEIDMAYQYKYWGCDYANITITDEEDEYEFTMDTKDFEPKNLDTPVGFSYHCSSLTIHEKPENGSRTKYENKVKLVMTDFQVQPFKIERNKFSKANDCTGYFTPGIWMGLIVTFILVFMFGAGMAMLADLKVMDKFDDPKKKTITVNVAEQ